MSGFHFFTSKDAAEKSAHAVAKAVQLDEEGLRIGGPQNGDQAFLSKVRWLEQFDAACRWISVQGKTKKINQRRSSYGLKHQAERVMGGYISNSAMIAAAVHCGFNLARLRDGSRNAQFNISSKIVEPASIG
ncbi:hypothetical protein H2509_20480 [Stappia sp. F7233]|uniref:Uncharacterized protein n=1 Tax=Stappia albiluteola TaxID=2758565 RepID=A0A839AKH8_9HYPH|nr:hypothetical protein [Stappia albiluteola]MBA5779514.1 hypothetical protein [Stappia albiluteola]